MELKSRFGFFKKPDINSVGSNTIYLTYNLPPKPAILGLVGAIMGWKSRCFSYAKGNGHLLDFDEKLKQIKVGIKPSGTFPFQKIQNKTNTCMGDVGNTFFTEQLLINPHYEIFFWGSEEIIGQISDRLENRYFAFNPHFGRNEFPVEIKKLTELEFEKIDKTNELSTIYVTQNHSDLAGSYESPYDFYEQYPVDFSNELQYKLRLVKYLKNREDPDNANEDLKDIDHKCGELLKLKRNGAVYVF